MFERFSRERLDQLLAKHPVTTAGQAYIEAAVTAPARNPIGTTKNVLSDIPCPKMCCSISSASSTLEKPFSFFHMFRDETIGYFTQVQPFEVAYLGRGDKRVRTTVTPSALVFDKDQGVILEQWFGGKLKSKLELKYPGRFERSPSGGFVSAAIEQELQRFGFAYKIRFSDELTEYGNRNRLLLYRFLGSGADKAYLPTEPALYQAFGSAPMRTAAELDDLGVGKDSLHWAIATNRLFTNVDEALLSSGRSSLHIFRERVAQQAWERSIRPDGSRPGEFKLEDKTLRPGDLLLVDGKQMLVKLVGASAIHVADEGGGYVQLDYFLLTNLMREGKLKLPDRLTRFNPRSRFFDASPACMTRALVRLATLTALERGEMTVETCGYSPSTIGRWKAQVSVARAQGLSDLEGLLDNEDTRGFRGPHIDPTLSSQLDAWLKEQVSDDTNRKCNFLYTAYEKIAGDHMVAKSTFYERYNFAKTADTERKAKGHKVAHNLEPVHWMLDLATPVHAEYPLQLVHIDSTRIDLEVSSSLSGDLLGRPWLTLAMCAFSRRVVGMHLSFLPPSSVSSMLCLADIVLRMGRLPDALINDHGAEFKGEDFRNALAGQQIIHHTRPKSCPRFGGILERMFGTTTTQIFNNMRGNTQLLKMVRSLTPAVDPRGKAEHTLATVAWILERYFFEIYDIDKHSTTLMTPRDRYNSMIEYLGQALHRCRSLDDLLPVLMPDAPGALRTIDPARGLFVNHRWYGAPELAKLHLAGQRVPVKPLPFDPYGILAFHDRSWIECRAAESSEVKALPRFMRRAMYEEWLLEQKLLSKSKDVTRRRIRDLLNEMSELAGKNVDYRGDPKFRDFLDTCVASDASAEGAAATALSGLEAKFRAAALAQEQAA